MKCMEFIFELNKEYSDPHSVIKLADHVKNCPDCSFLTLNWAINQFDKSKEV